MTDTWNHQIQPWREARRSGDGRLFVFLGITNLETITHCEQELEVRSATHDVRGPNFSLHPSGKAGRWQTGLLLHLHLYSNQGMFSVPVTQQHLLHFPRHSRGDPVEGKLS